MLAMCFCGRQCWSVSQVIAFMVRLALGLGQNIHLYEYNPLLYDQIHAKLIVFQSARCFICLVIIGKCKRANMLK